MEERKQQKEEEELIAVIKVLTVPEAAYNIFSKHVCNLIIAYLL